MTADFFNPEAIFRNLLEHKVRYLCVGGVAATLYGSPLRTVDVDICVQKNSDNLLNLAKALKTMKAKMRTTDAVAGLPFDCSPAFFENRDICNLITKHGPLDVIFKMSGPYTYEKLLPNRQQFDLDGLPVSTAALGDIIASKEATNRDKDRAALPTLKKLLKNLQDED